MSLKFLRRILLMASILFAIAFPCSMVAHDGPVDGNGCHLDQKKRLHCH